MKWVIWILAIFLLLTVSDGIFININSLPVVPSILLILCTTALILGDHLEAWLIMIVSGIFLDFASGLPDGIMLTSILLAALFVYVVVNWFLAKEFNIPILFLSVGLMTFLFIVFSLALVKIYSFLQPIEIDYSYILLNKLFWYIMINLILTYPIYLYFNLINRLAFRVSKR
ncbi:MAG TPA: hypothetical protein VD998_02315 [Verrucomicrobiae bacterium]|nr:hypothetical protein [Verrucomicrobiae bacterium]